ncbi:MAG: alpha/beta fold hydrolase [Gammaproteobacteria bacterium]
MTNTFLDVRGARLHACSRGQGPALVWAHGLLSSMAAEDGAGMWPDKSDGTLVRYDARGHGASAAVQSVDEACWDALAQDMLAVAAALVPQPFCAGGVSLGAATALCAALHAPEQVGRLVLMGPPPLWEARAPFARQYVRIAAAGMATIERLAGVSSRDLPPWLAQARLTPRAQALRPDSALLYAAAAASNLPPRERLRLLADVPALIIGWEGDPGHPWASALELHRLLPRSILHPVRSLPERRALPALIARFATVWPE